MFSVIIPIFNKISQLDRSINSVLNQTFQEFELLLIDDASNDGSSEKLKEYDDHRIRIFARDSPGPGGYAARNLGIGEAKYDWVAFLDADDEWGKDHLKDINDTILEGQNVEIVSTKWVKSKNGISLEVAELKKFKEKKRVFSLIDFFYTKSLMWTGAIAIQTELLKEVGGFPEGKCRRGGDMDTWIRCLYRSKKNIFINSPSVTYFLGIENQVTSNKTNPTNTICAQETLNEIRKDKIDYNLQNAIDKYISSFIYGFMLRDLKNGIKIDKSKLNIIQSNKIKYRILFKLFIYRILFILRLK